MGSRYASILSASTTSSRICAAQVTQAVQGIPGVGQSHLCESFAFLGEQGRVQSELGAHVVITPFRFLDKIESIPSKTVT